MLAATAVASPPLALMPFTTSSHAGSLRLETMTLAPCAAICSQIERPMPRLPPVTTATLPERSNIIELASPLESHCGVCDEFLSQNLSFSLATQTGRRPATSVQVLRVCWREQNEAP